MYHYVTDEGVVYLCITDDEFERSKAFLFLEDIKTKFKDSYRETAIQSALPFAMHSEFSDVLKETMNHYSTASLTLLPTQKLDNIRVRNLELVEEGELEQLELLESTDSVSVRSLEALLLSPGHLRRRCCDGLKDNWKIIAAIVLIAFFIVVIIVAIVLGVCLQEQHSTCSKVD